MPSHFACLTEEEETQATEPSYDGSGASVFLFRVDDRHCGDPLCEAPSCIRFMEDESPFSALFGPPDSIWADMMVETSEEDDVAFAQRNGGMTIAMLLAAAKEVKHEEVPFVPFVEDPWARNANGTIMCCRNQAHGGIKGTISPAENGFAAGCNAHTAHLPCVGTHEGTALFGKRFAHMDEPEWTAAQPREQGRTSTDNWRVPPFMGCRHCVSAQGVPMTNHTSSPQFVTPHRKLCGKVLRGIKPPT